MAMNQLSMHPAPIRRLLPILLCATTPLSILAAEGTGYVRLTPLPPPKIVEHAKAYPGGNYEAGNLVDANPRSEYSSDGKGTNTFIVFEFAAPTRIAGFRHVDRN